MSDNKKNCCSNSCEQNRVDAFIDSVEEEIRNENWQKIWDKYGKLITYVSCAFVVSVGVYGMWKKHNAEKIDAISTKFSALQRALEHGPNDELLVQLKELSIVAEKDYTTLIKFEYAAALKSKNDIASINEYKSIYENEKTNPVLKELAYIFYVNCCLDLMPSGELLNAIDGFISELSEKYSKGFWNLIAKESLAYCYIKNDKNDLARETLEALAKTSGITAGMEQRVKTLLNYLG